MVEIFELADLDLAVEAVDPDAVEVEVADALALLVIDSTVLVLSTTN